MKQQCLNFIEKCEAVNPPCNDMASVFFSYDIHTKLIQLNGINVQLNGINDETKSIYVALCRECFPRFQVGALNVENIRVYSYDEWKVYQVIND
jgi:hypothetical protein